MPPARLRLPLAFAVGLGLSLGPALAHAQEAGAPLQVQPDDLVQLKAELARQAKLIAGQQRQIERLAHERDEILAAIRAGRSTGETSGAAVAQLQQVPNAVTEAPPVAPTAGAADAAPSAPVGQKPPERPIEVAAAIPQQVGVLTPRGHLVIDPSIEYMRTSNNRLVFRGVEIVPGINLGVVEANNAASDTGVATFAARYGLTDRLEVEARIPYVVRHDRVTTVAQQQDNFTQTRSLDGRDLGDVEIAARYQLNHGQNGWPIFVATTRVKPPTGVGPYDVDYDEAGVAQGLATGSGFWGLEGGVTMLYPSDPAIIFASLTYLHNFSRDVNRNIGSGNNAVHVGEVTPGDSIGASLGFGLSLNPRFSVSFGYSHSYIEPTTSLLSTGGQPPVKAKALALQVGSLLMGWSFRLTDRLTLNNAYEMGVTSDAPDMRVVFRLPYRF